MARHDKTLLRLLRGTSDASIGFDEVCDLLRRLHFRLTFRGRAALLPATVRFEPHL